MTGKTASSNVLQEKPAERTLCLTMMVKDESAVILRCLETAKPHIDYWVITDTGSSDNTRELIKEYLADIPGELHEEPWKNFGHNRSRLMELARGKADYLLLLDADEGLTVHNRDFKKYLTADSYFVAYSGPLLYRQKLLLKADCHWQYFGVTHEYIWAEDDRVSDNIDTISYLDFDDGSRHDVKFDDDIRLLEEGLVEEPDNTRYLYYLAQSYYNKGDMVNALLRYRQRSELGGWEEEIYASKLGVAHCLSAIEETFAVHAYVDAFEYRPQRLEAIYFLIRHYREQEKFHYAYMLAKQAERIPFPIDDYLFVDKSITDYKLQDELAICAYWIGNYHECRKICRALLKNPLVPEDWRPRIEQNLKFASENLK